MGEDIDYFNLLTDTLRSSYLQVEKIYNSIEKIRDNPSEYSFVNIRTGYRVKYHFKDSRYYYNSNDKYPLCYNFESNAGATTFTLRRLILTYEKWLGEYERNRDIKLIKKLVEDELKEAKSKCRKNIQENSKKSPLELLGELAKNRCPRMMQKIFRDEWDEDECESEYSLSISDENDSITHYKDESESDYEEDSFIVKTEDEEYYTNHNSAKKSKDSHSYIKPTLARKKVEGLINFTPRSERRPSVSNSEETFAKSHTESKSYPKLKVKRLRKSNQVESAKKENEDDEENEDNEFDFEIPINNYDDTPNKKSTYIVSD